MQLLAKSPSIRHRAPIASVDVHGPFVATAGYDNNTILWAIANGAALGRISHDHLANSCAFSPDGKFLAAASSDRTIRIVEVPSMRTVLTLATHDDDVMKVAFSPDGGMIASCSYDSTCHIYCARSGKNLAVCRGHKGLIESFDWSRDGKKLFSCGTDGSIRTWAVATGEQLSIRDGLEFDVDAVLVLDDNRFIAGCDNGELWAFAGQEVERYPGHTSGVKRLVLSKDRTRLLSLGYDRRLISWRLTEDGRLQKIRESQLPAYVWARSAAFHTNDEVIFATFGSTFARWHASTDTWSAEGYVPSLSLNSVLVDAGHILTVGDAGVVVRDGEKIGSPGTLCNCLVSDGARIWTTGQLGLIYDMAGHVHHDAGVPINCAARVKLASGAYRLFFGTYGGGIIVLEPTPTGLKHLITIQLECNAIKGLANIGGAIAAGAADSTIAIVDGDTLRVRHLATGGHAGIVNGIAAYRDGFATISRDLTMRFWNPDAQHQQTIPSRHSHSIKCIAASTDGHLIATGSYGGTVDLYDVDAGQWVGDRRRPTMSGISSLAWHDGEQAFLASSYDGKVYAVAR